MWLVVVTLLCHAAAQLHGILKPTFLNLDVAGIVYNARLLLAGRLPYVNSIEIKPPGAFLLFAPWIALGGLRAIWVFSVVWATATSLAAGCLGALCWGRRWLYWTCLLHAAGAVLASDADINYSFWMTFPLTLAAACVAASATRSNSRERGWLWFVAGASLTFAILIRPSAAPVGLLLVAVAYAERKRLGLKSAILQVVFGIAGAAGLVLLLSLPFIQSGNFEAVISGYSNVKRYANDSVASIVTGAGGRWSATFVGLQCLPEQLPIGHILLALSLLPLGIYKRAEDRRDRAYIAWVFAATCLLGVTLTLRFFSHDNAPLWVAYSIVAVRPSGLVGRMLLRLSCRRGAASWAAWGMGALATVISLRGVIWQNRFMRNNDERVADLCRRIEPHLGKRDSVLAWGWTAWGVYEHCGRWAPGPVYKDLTNVTTVNTNTCNRGYEPMRFRQGPLADRYLEDLQRGRPALIVVSDYYKGMGGDPLDEWHDARIFIREHYVTIETRGEFRALLRSDLAPQLGLPSENLVPFTSGGEPMAVMNACGSADEFWQSVLDPDRSTSIEVDVPRLPLNTLSEGHVVNGPLQLGPAGSKRQAPYRASTSH